MFRTTLKNLAARKLRLLTTSVAVLLGVAFMAGTLILTATLDKTLSSTVAGAYAGTDVHVRGDLQFDDELMGDQRAQLDDALVALLRSVDGVAAAEGHTEAFAQVVDKGGEPMGDPNMGAPVIGGEWIADDELNPFGLVAGHVPTAADEVVLDEATADDGGFVVGDAVTVLTQAGPQHVTVAGIAALDDGVSLGGAQVTMFTPEATVALLGQPGKVPAIQLRAEGGVSQQQLADRIARVVPEGVEVLTGDELVAEEQQNVKDDMAFFNTFLMAFALIALFVGSFIIYNSFSILVAQRTKEMALMRAIGAGRRQVMGAVVLEATVVGLLAAGLGLAAGIGVAAGLQAMLAGMGLDLPSGGIVLTQGAVIASFVTGVGVSVASAVFPARRASKVAPVAAMRDVAFDRSASSATRVVVGSVIAGGGAVAIGGALFGGAGAGLLAVGAPLVFVGVSVLGPVIARPASKVIGWPLPRLRGMAGTIARENAMRNPKRTSATAAALMIGVALVGMITILASSTKASIRDSLAADFKGDLVVASASGMGTGGLSTDLADRLAELPELDVVTGYRLAAAEVDGHVATLLSADPDAAEALGELRVTDGSAADLGLGALAVDEDEAADRGWAVGDVLPVRFAETGVQQLRIAALFERNAFVGTYLVDHATYDANMATRFDYQVVVTAADGVSVEEARAAVTSVTDADPLAEVQDREEYAEAVTANADMILNLMYVLLGLAVFIALLGIANTLALSIFERTRELGLLRAVGMSRSQLRSAVRYEAVVIAVFGTGLGLAIGTTFGWAIVRALRDEGLGTFQLPVSTLVVLTAIGALAGVAAAVLPARRAARLDVLGAITSD